jgi:hypothetical protein
MCGVVGSPATSSRAIVRERLAHFLEVALAPEIDGVPTHTEPSRHFACGETLAEEQHHAASQNGALRRGSRPNPTFELGSIARADEKRS